MKKNFETEKEFLILPEITCCYYFNNDRIVKTREIIYENKQLNIVFEYMD